MKSCLLLAALLFVSGSALAGARTFKGQITDSQCAYDVHSVTRSHKEMSSMKGFNGRQCAIFCVEKGDSVYVFEEDNGRSVYKLSTPQKDLKQYAGKEIEITGQIDAAGKNITVSRIKLLGWAHDHLRGRTPNT